MIIFNSINAVEAREDQVQLQPIYNDDKTNRKSTQHEVLDTDSTKNVVNGTIVGGDDKQP